MRRDAAVLGFGALVAVGLAASGCSGSSPAPAASSGSAATSTPSKTSSASPSPTPSATGFAATCESALPVTSVDQAAGLPIIGSTSFVIGVAEPNIGRLAYLNCRYGLPDPVAGQPAPVPQVEIGVSLYNSADRATTRANGTVEDYRSHGAAPTSVRVGSSPGTVLAGYGATTLVVVQGARTVAVSVAPEVLTSNDVLVNIAGLALTNVK